MLKNHTHKKPTTHPKQTQKPPQKQKLTWKSITDKLIIAYKMKLAAQVSQVMLFDVSLGMGFYNASPPFLHENTILSIISI